VREALDAAARSLASAGSFVRGEGKGRDQAWRVQGSLGGPLGIAGVAVREARETVLGAKRERERTEAERQHALAHLDRHRAQLEALREEWDGHQRSWAVEETVLVLAEPSPSPLPSPSLSSVGSAIERTLTGRKATSRDRSSSIVLEELAAVERALREAVRSAEQAHTHAHAQTNVQGGGRGGSGRRPGGLGRHVHQVASLLQAATLSVAHHHGGGRARGNAEAGITSHGRDYISALEAGESMRARLRKKAEAGERARMRAELDAGARKMSAVSPFDLDSPNGASVGAVPRVEGKCAIADVAAIGRAMEAARHAIESEGPLSTAERAVRDCAALVNAAVGASQ